MQYSDKTKEKCPDLTYGRCVDLGWGRSAVFVLPIILKTSAQHGVALYVVTVLTAGTPGVAEIVSSLRVKSKDFQEAFFAITREFFGVFSLRLLRSAGTFGHFYSSP